MKAEAIILLVSMNQRNLQLLAEYLGKEGYLTATARSLEEFDQLLAGENNVEMALVDITGFDQGIWQRCEQLRGRGQPFLVISPTQSVAIQRASLSHGARGVMIKPLVVKELMGLVKGLLDGQA